MTGAKPIRDWLGELGLAQHAETFEREQIDVDALRHLTEDHLKDLGLPMGQAPGSDPEFVLHTCVRPGRPWVTKCAELHSTPSRRKDPHVSRCTGRRTQASHRHVLRHRWFDGFGRKSGGGEHARDAQPFL